MILIVCTIVRNTNGSEERSSLEVTTKGRRSHHSQNTHQKPNNTNTSNNVCQNSCNMRSTLSKMRGSCVNKGGVCDTGALPFTLKSILRQKKNYGNSNISPSKNIIFKKVLYKKPKSFRI
jgi:hypothetical protein